MRVATAPVSAEDGARTLLENIRRTPMVRGGRLLEPRRLLKAHIEGAMVDHGVPERLAARLAFQLVLKCPPNQLGVGPVWTAMAAQVLDEVGRLRERLGLTDRLLTVGVPKLSADDIESLFDEMRGVDARYGRTLAEAALDGAEPWVMARRYGKAFTEAVRRLSNKNPRIARTLAAAAFRSRHPLTNALKYLSRFEALVEEFEGNVGFARTVAKAAFIAPDPVRAARRFIRDYRAVVRELTAQGLEPSIARSLAGIAALCGEPLKTARTLVQKFREVENLVKCTHPQVARTVALAACRATDPLTTACAYIVNYDRIVSTFERVDPRRARRVANQAFRTHDPMAWATRFHRQIASAAEVSSFSVRLCDTPMLDVPASPTDHRADDVAAGRGADGERQQMIENALSETGGRASGRSRAASHLGLRPPHSNQKTDATTSTSIAFACRSRSVRNAVVRGSG